jgi:hypothetical protein
MRKALATVIAEKVDQTNVRVRETMALGVPPTDDFNALMFDAGQNVGLLTKALGRVLLFDELTDAARLALHELTTAGAGQELTAICRELIARAMRDGA